MFRKFTLMFSILFVKTSGGRVTLATGSEGSEEEMCLLVLRCLGARSSCHKWAPGGMVE